MVTTSSETVLLAGGHDPERPLVDRTDAASSRGRTAAVVLGLAAVAAGLPLAVALGVLHDPHWYPALDLAQTEMRIRDVGSSHPPLIGLAGRFFGFGQRGSHPGPLSFWSMWPLYKAFGSSGWAMQAATASLNLLATAAAIWIGHRRGGVRLALAMALVMAVLVQAYTTERLTEPWNPFLPPLWWVVFLLAVWSVIGDDLPMLPIAVFAGSFCAQTHISYLGLVAGLGVVTTLVVGVRHVARQGRRERRRALIWGGASLGLLVVLWLPPVIEQLTEDLGNMGLLRENFSHPLDEEVGWGDGLSAWLAHLDVRGLFRIEGALGISEAPHGSPVPGLLLLAAWLVAAVFTWRRRRDNPGLWRLHVTVGLAALLGLISISRVLGELWDYLVLWAWGTTALMLLATCLSASLALHVRTTRPAGPRAHLAATAEADASAGGPGTGATGDPAPATAASRSVLAGGGAAAPGRAGGLAVAWLNPSRQVAVLVGALVLVVGVATYDAAHAQPPNEYESKVLTVLVPATTAALQEGRLPDGTPVPGGGPQGHYLVRWLDNDLATPGGGFGLLLELERAGLDAGGPAYEAAPIAPHRVLDLADATATVNHVVGDNAIARWRARPGAVEVADVDPRTPAERRRFDQLEDQVVAALRERGLDDLAAGMDGNVLTVSMSERMPDDIEEMTSEMLDIGGPAAIFVAPPESG